MFRIRFHGRGGQGMKTASRILGTALFDAGYEVQDAPRYGAERRGAPIFAYVRAARHAIHERGVIQRPDLVLVADDTLIGVPAAGVVEGLGESTWLVVLTTESEATWRDRVKHPGPMVTLPPPAALSRTDESLVGPLLAGAAARMLGVVARDSLERAVRGELEGYAAAAVEARVGQAMAGFDGLAAHEGAVAESGELAVASFEAPRWIELPHDAAARAAPAIHAAHTSVEVRTGLWRTLRPVIDHARCNRCNWICSTFCPDSAIRVDEAGWPRIDLDHCKGCMICVAQCPPHAIAAVPEHEAAEAEAAAAPGAEP